jgi:hypoxanthine phosphoribosyltransferase
VTGPAFPEVCESVLLSEEAIRDRVAQLGADIAGDYAGSRIRLVSVLRGGLFFLADLTRAIEADLTIDFLAVSPYAPGRGGVVRVTKDLDDDIAGERVILVEDVVDTGLTVNYVLSLLRARAPESLEVCSLLDKSARRIADVPIAYRGFELPDRFVVGYGLDLDGLYRNLPFIATLHDEVVEG